jgi:hypothetical protein
LSASEHRESTFFDDEDDLVPLPEPLPLEPVSPPPKDTTDPPPLPAAAAQKNKTLPALLAPPVSAELDERLGELHEVVAAAAAAAALTVRCCARVYV